ncbi:YlaI family protein [Saliterribacillus persicus]|uniref:Uncharacterized protein YlaI n=1 Tax=Saliterribacillus persicus TaxID=930114 RepID=A0A368XS12_9BACI|nr:YlaI family protein [Saliterribacillus persicus]RCW70840.1 uncharacterized protein YlaI [Saliterribacillus persicus]
MRVKCVICDVIDNIDSNSPEAKKLRNRRIHTYLCKECNDRITEKTQARIATGNFHLYRKQNDEDSYI